VSKKTTVAVEKTCKNCRHFPCDKYCLENRGMWEPKDGRINPFYAAVDVFEEESEKCQGAPEAEPLVERVKRRNLCDTCKYVFATCDGIPTLAIELYRNSPEPDAVVHCLEYVKEPERD